MFWLCWLWLSGDVFVFAVTVVADRVFDGASETWQGYCVISMVDALVFRH